MQTNIKIKKVMADHDSTNNTTRITALYENLKEIGYGKFEYYDSSNNWLGGWQECLPTITSLLWVSSVSYAGNLSDVRIRAKSCKSDNCPDFVPVCYSELNTTSRIDNITVTNVGLSVPPTPTGLILTPGYKSVKIEFTPGVGGVNILGYNITVSTPTKVIKTGILPYPDTSITISNIDPGTYDVSVQAMGVRFDAEVSGTITASVTISPSDYTDTIKLYITPWPWYSSGGATDWFVTKLVDINGQIVNFFAQYVGDYNYIGTYITFEKGYVTINIDVSKKWQQASLYQTLQEPVEIAWGTELAIVLVALTISVGLLELTWDWVPRTDPSKPKPGTPATPKEIAPNLADTVVKATNNCANILGTGTATCEDVQDVGICLDSVTMGIMGTLIAHWPNFDGFKTLYKKYEYTFKTKSESCTPGNETAITNEMYNIRNTFNNELADQFVELQKLYEEAQSGGCYISNPFGGCLMSRSTAKKVGILAGLGILAYATYKIAKR